jgi:hypothetical protein
MKLPRQGFLRLAAGTVALLALPYTVGAQSYFRALTLSRMERRDTRRMVPTSTFSLSPRFSKTNRDRRVDSFRTLLPSLA